MRITRFVASAAVVLVAALFASAHARAQFVAGTAWEAGKHYFLIDPPVATTSGDKVEVTEVFSYGCPACNMAYPQIARLRKTLPPNAVMTYVPAAFNAAEDWPMFQRAYLTAKALGIADAAHEAMFDAVWKSGELAILDKTTNRPKQPLPTIEDAAAFYAKYGAKTDEFVATANSFTINTRMKQADAYVKASGVDQTPTLVVNGKYRLTVPSAGGWDKVEQLVQFLIRKEAGGK